MSFTSEESSFAWMVGLLEGEGCFTTWTSPKHKRRYPRISCQMTDRDIVDHVHAIAGVGNVHGPYVKGALKKDTWSWSVTRVADAVALMEALYPLMGQRRQARIAEILLEWRSN